MKILVVDDEPEICDFLEEFLTQRGYQVFAAANGEEAISKVEEVKPHMVLLDIRMPGMSGMEVLPRIEQIDDKIGVIITTVVRDLDTVKQALRMGANDYITKPIDLDYLEKLLISWKQVFLEENDSGGSHLD